MVCSLLAYMVRVCVLKLFKINYNLASMHIHTRFVTTVPQVLACAKMRVMVILWSVTDGAVFLLDL